MGFERAAAEFSKMKVPDTAVAIMLCECATSKELALWEWRVYRLSNFKEIDDAWLGSLFSTY